MGFRTKLDYSSNRQISQREKTDTILSGSTIFGLPFSGLTIGPNLNQSGNTEFYSNVISTFSGNSTTTIYTWFDPRMELAIGYLSAMTPSTSGITQYVENIFIGNNYNTIDGNISYTDYSGVSFDIISNNMVDLGGGSYSGTVQHFDLYFLSATSLDYSGRTIWIDNPEITRTDRLIITDNPVSGYVWTCIDSEGMGEWQYNSSSSGTTIWTAGTGTNSAVLGGQNITGASANTVYAPNINIDKQDGLYASKLGVNTSSPLYPLDIYGSNVSRVFYSSTAPIGGGFYISATTGLPFVAAATNSGVINQNGSISIGMRAWDDVTYTAYGKQGDTHLYSSKQANGLLLISTNGTNTEDYIECYVGGDAGGGGGELAIHMHGTGTTKGYVGFDTNLPTERLDVNGNGRFRSIGSSASAGALHYTADGTLTTNTSDERLKTNITQLTGALDKVNQLRGVTYNWTENPTGDTRIGFIAQEVNNIVPELTFVNPNSEEKYMGVHYDNVTALLVEAIKELSNDLITSNNTFLETQTILAEDNNIELNYNGTHESALDGGITIINGINENNNTYFKINSDGDFITNVNLIPKGIVIPEYTPISSLDTNGVNGNFTRDENYLYIKYNNTWKRANLENF